jgi:hypothetical protein
LPDAIKARFPKLHQVAAKSAEAEAEKKRIERLIRISREALVTATSSIDGHRIRKYLGIECVEFVIGTGVFSEVTSSIADFFGARSTAADWYKGGLDREQTQSCCPHQAYSGFLKSAF